MREYQPAYPCDSTDLVYFRKRIGEGIEKIFAMSVNLHPKAKEEKEVIVDTTVQEKNITYPTDGKLAIKMIHHLHKIAKEEKIQLRRTYVKEIKGHRISLRFFRHPKKIKKAKSAIKRLKTITGILIRDLKRNMNEEQLNKYQEIFELFLKVANQKQKDSNKIYSLHEQHIYAIAKGKDHKKYEYGTKASIVITKKSNIIIGVAAHQKNEHDSKTLHIALKQAKKYRTKPIKEAICDRGYRGKKEIDNIKICIPDKPLKKDSKYQREQKRKKFRRRASIEPIIGHLKTEHRLARNYLKGFVGDEINLLMAAAAFNFKKWMNIYFFALFLQDITLLQIATMQIQKVKLIYLYLFGVKVRLWYEN